MSTSSVGDEITDRKASLAGESPSLYDESKGRGTQLRESTKFIPDGVTRDGCYQATACLLSPSKLFAWRE